MFASAIVCHRFRNKNMNRTQVCEPHFDESWGHDRGPKDDLGEFCHRSFWCGFFVFQKLISCSRRLSTEY